MLRNIAGIMADEEPKTAISASGLYNSSNLGGLVSDSDLSSTLLNGASELTFMMWISVDDFSIYTTVPARPFIEFNPTSYPISINSTGVQAQIANSGGGNTIATHFRSFSENTFYHICVTQSLSNNRIRLYVDGISSASAVMNYSNSSLSTTARLQDEVGVSIAQLNVFNRELSETEVAEHYVYDDDTMTSGVLGWDAMTPAQRSGLIYSSSYTDDISISGNEFNDKSGNGITISPQPSLTGEQIYFYTNASDLPSDTTIYNVNSARIGPSFQGYNAGNTAGLQLTNQGSVYVWVRSEGPSSLTLILSKSQYTGNQQGYEIRTQGSKYLVSISSDGSGSGVTQISTTSNVTSATYTLVGFEYDGSNLSISYDGQIQTSTPYTGGIHNSTAPFMISGYGGSNQGEFPFDGSVFQPLVYKRALTQTERDDIYNGGTPICFDAMVVNQPSLADAEYTSRLGNWGSNAGEETDDQSGNGITTTPINTPTYTDQGLTVECD